MKKTPAGPRTAEHHGVGVGVLTNREGKVGDGSGVVPSDATGTLVELELPRHFDGALALKSERIVYCPIQKVSWERLIGRTPRHWCLGRFHHAASLLLLAWLKVLTVVVKRRSALFCASADESMPKRHWRVSG